MEIVNIVGVLLAFTIYSILRLLQLELTKINIEFLYQWKNQNLGKEEIIEKIFKNQIFYKNSISVFSIIFLIITITAAQNFVFTDLEYNLNNFIYLMVSIIAILGIIQLILIYVAYQLGMKSILKTNYLIRGLGIIYIPVYCTVCIRIILYCTLLIY